MSRKNYESRETYNEDNQIRFKTSLLRSHLCDYSNAYLLVKGTITVRNIATDSTANNTANKKVIFKNWALFSISITKINNAQVDGAHDIDIIMPMYNLIGYSNNIQKHLEFF